MLKIIFVKILLIFNMTIFATASTVENTGGSAISPLIAPTKENNTVSTNNTPASTSSSSLQNMGQRATNNTNLNNPGPAATNMDAGKKKIKKTTNQKIALITANITKTENNITHLNNSILQNKDPVVVNTLQKNLAKQTAKLNKLKAKLATLNSLPPQANSL